MKKFVILWVLSLIYCQAAERIDVHKCKIDQSICLVDDVYTFVDQMPVYPGGEMVILLYVADNFRYPEDDLYFQASFMVDLIIDEDGQVDVFRINEKFEQNFTNTEKEMALLFHQMPVWESGKCKNTDVKVKVSIPIRF